jgi:hypothetical protein
MFGEDQNDLALRWGIDEALACQDMLERVSPRPSLLERARAWIAAALRAPPLRAGVDTHPTHPAATRRIS